MACPVRSRRDTINYLRKKGGGGGRGGGREGRTNDKRLWRAKRCERRRTASRVEFGAIVARQTRRGPFSHVRRMAVQRRRGVSISYAPTTTTTTTTTTLRLFTRSSTISGRRSRRRRRRRFQCHLNFVSLREVEATSADQRPATSTKNAPAPAPSASIGTVTATTDRHAAVRASNVSRRRGGRRSASSPAPPPPAHTLTHAHKRARKSATTYEYTVPGSKYSRFPFRFVFVLFTLFVFPLAIVRPSVYSSVGFSFSTAITSTVRVYSPCLHLFCILVCTLGLVFVRDFAFVAYVSRGHTFSFHFSTNASFEIVFLRLPILVYL